MAGFTQRQFAKLVKRPNSTLSAYETGRKTPSDELLVDFAKALKCSPDEFFIPDGDLKEWEGFEDSLITKMGRLIDSDDTKEIRLGFEIFQALKPKGTASGADAQSLEGFMNGPSSDPESETN